MSESNLEEGHQVLNPIARFSYSKNSIITTVSKENNDPRSAKQDVHDDEEELELHNISKEHHHQNQDFEEDILRPPSSLNYMEKSSNRPQSHSSLRSDNSLYVRLLKKQEEDHVARQQIQAIMSKMQDPKALVEQIEKYQPRNKELSIPLLKSQGKLKVKRYKQCIYFGEIINAKRHGKGVMLYTDGRTYEGEWENDLKHGVGVEVLANSNRYEGEFLNGKPEGSGAFYWANGEFYEGDWKNGLKHGSGMWKGTKGESYTGEWKNGKADGYGVHKWRNGDKYEGEFKGFLKHGQGTERFMNGDYYVGNYVNGKPDGYGEYFWTNGCCYKGTFRNGLRHGKGVWRKDKESPDVYEGNWVNDKKCGQGIYTWASGNVYEGEYFDDLRHGYGEMYWNDGSYYKGSWERGIQHGEGELMIPDKVLQKGLFINNQFVDDNENDLRVDTFPKMPEHKNKYEISYRSGNIEEQSLRSVTPVRDNRSREKGSERSRSHNSQRKMVPIKNNSLDRSFNQTKDSFLQADRSVIKLSEMKQRPNANSNKFIDLSGGDSHYMIKRNTAQPVWKSSVKQVNMQLLNDSNGYNASGANFRLIMKQSSSVIKQREFE